LQKVFRKAKLKAGIKKIKILPVPVFGYAPETKTYFGAVALQQSSIPFNFDKIKIQNENIKSQNQQKQTAYFLSINPLFILISLIQELIKSKQIMI
jgi:hypothetical protein